MTGMRRLVSSGSPLEPRIGFSRGLLHLLKLCIASAQRLGLEQVLERLFIGGIRITPFSQCLR